MNFCTTVRSELSVRSAERSSPLKSSTCGIHGRKTRPIARAFERFEIQLGQVDAIPAKAGNQLFYSLTGRAEAIALEGYVGVGCVQAHDLPEPIGAASVSPALSSV